MSIPIVSKNDIGDSMYGLELPSVVVMVILGYTKEMNTIERKKILLKESFDMILMNMQRKKTPYKLKGELDIEYAVSHAHLRVPCGIRLSSFSWIGFEFVDECHSVPIDQIVGCGISYKRIGPFMHSPYGEVIIANGIYTDDPEQQEYCFILKPTYDRYGKEFELDKAYAGVATYVEPLPLPEKRKKGMKALI